MSDALAARVRLAFQIALVVQILALGFSIGLSSIASGVALALFLVLAFGRRRETLHATGLEWYFAAYAVSLLVMCFFAVYPMASLVDSRKALLIATAYFVIAACRTQRELTMLLSALVIFSAVQSAYEIAIYYIADSTRLGIFQIYMTTAGMKMIALLSVIPLVLWKNMNPRLRTVLAVSCAVILFALVLTETRSSWFGFMAGIVVIGLFTYRSILIGLAALVLLVVLLSPANLQERIRFMFSTTSMEESSTTRSNVLRVRMWETGWKMFLDKPVFGVGEGEFWLVYRMYTKTEFDDEGGHLHNNVVHLLASHGAFGLLVVLVLFARIVMVEWKIFRESHGSFASAIALGSLAAFIGFFINGMAEYNFGDHEILVMLWMTVGLAIAAKRIGESAA